jgi:single-strand DNA-binding protein
MINNLLIVTGNAVSDPVTRTTGNGRVVTKVRVASNEQKFNPETQQWETVNTSFWNVSCWQMLGERVATSIRRGDPVLFVGRPSVREFQRQEGHTDHSVDVNADLFGPDLRRVSVDVHHKQRPALVPAEQPAVAEPAA